MPTLLDRAITGWFGKNKMREAPASGDKADIPPAAAAKKEPTAKADDGTPVWSRGFGHFSSQGADGEVDYKYDDNGGIVPVDQAGQAGPDNVPDSPDA